MGLERHKYIYNAHCQIYSQLISDSSTATLTKRCVNFFWYDIVLYICQLFDFVHLVDGFVM